MDWSGHISVTFWAQCSDPKGTHNPTDINPRLQWNDPPAPVLLLGLIDKQSIDYRPILLLYVLYFCAHYLIEANLFDLNIHHVISTKSDHSDRG